MGIGGLLGKSTTTWSNEQILSSATAGLFGLGTDAVPNQVLSILSSAALYKEGAGLSDVFGNVFMKLPQIVTGSYTGNGASTRSVNLGVQPRAVIVMRQGYMTDGGDNPNDRGIYGGMSVSGSDAKNSSAYGIRLEPYGFDVFTDDLGFEHTNDKGIIYNYLAFR